MEPFSPQFTAVIADDEPSILKGLKDAISWTELGVNICGLAQDGRQALNQIITHNPNLAIIDIKMPELNGLDVIRGAKDAGVDTDFIILSGYNDFSYAKEAIKYGARSYLLKPLNRDELYDEIYRILSEQAINRRDNSGNNPYADSPGPAFFNNLIDSKVLDSGKIDSALVTSHTNLSNSACYVLTLLFPEAEESDAPAFLTLIGLLDAHFVHTKHKFWKYDNQKLIGIFNTSNVTSFQTAMQCLEVIEAASHELPIVGVGDTVSGLFECSYSYNRALTALTYQLYDEHSRIFTYELICTVPPKVRLSDIDLLPLVQYIVKKDKEGITSYCNSFVDSLLYVTMPPPNYVFSLCYALFNLIEQEFSSFSKEDIKVASNASDLYQFKKLSQIRQWMIDSFCQLSEFVDAVYGYSHSNPYEDNASEASVAEDEIIRKAKEYIHNNISRHIKIEDIARQVHLSPSYFAIYFKNKTNVNLRDYLLTEKMEYAKQKLSEPNAAVSEIAYDLGYGDYRSFSRAFKKICGMTPSDYQLQKR